MNNKLKGQRLSTKGTVHVKHLARGSQVLNVLSPPLSSCQQALASESGPVRAPRSGARVLERAAAPFTCPDEARCGAERGFHPPAIWKAFRAHASLPDVVSETHRLHGALPGRRQRGYRIMRTSSVEQEPRATSILFVKTDKRGGRSAPRNRIRPVNLPEGALEGTQTAGCIHMKPHYNRGSEQLLWIPRGTRKTRGLIAAQG